jgi:beta-N-acetylhexosaminidase
MLADIRAGMFGSVILMGDNTAGGLAATESAIRELQQASRQGGNPGLLIMTDQEGGQVRRLPGPPNDPASGMSDPGVAYQQGTATGAFLKQAGVNVDLAPVADVPRIDGFMAQEQRTFGSVGARPRAVAAATCAFARGVASQGIAYTLKHFPGLGDAVQSTDNVPVSINEPYRQLERDDTAYAECGRSPLALVMVSSASYPALTGTVPAVLSPRIYGILANEGAGAVTISDSFESGAIHRLAAPARTAVNAGLDMVMYPGYQSAAELGYRVLLRDAETGSLNTFNVRAADDRIRALKSRLGLA